MRPGEGDGCVNFWKICFDYVCCGCQEAWAHVKGDTWRVQKNELFPMELEFQFIMDHLPWVLGTRFRSLIRAGCTVNHWVFSLAQSLTSDAVHPLKLDLSFPSSPSSWGNHVVPSEASTSWFTNALASSTETLPSFGEFLAGYSTVGSIIDLLALREYYQQNLPSKP